MAVTVRRLEFLTTAQAVIETLFDVFYDPFSIQEICKSVGADQEESSVWIFDSESSLWMQMTSNKTLNLISNFFLTDSRDLIIRIQSHSSPPNQSAEATKSKYVEIPTNEIEPFSQERIEDDYNPNLVQIHVENQNYKIRLNWFMLLQFVKFQLSSGFSPYNVEVSAYIESISENIKITLTKSIWQKYLLRHHAGCEEYMIFLTDILGNIIAVESSLKDLHSNTDLWFRLKVFHRDLCSFSQHQDKFLTSNDMFMSDYYFSDEERLYLYNFPTSNGLSVRDVFAHNMQHIVNSRGEYEICASHDFAPLLVTLFKLKKGYENEKVFQSYYKQFHKQRAKGK
jgi:hypothetical protein